MSAFLIPIGKFPANRFVVVSGKMNCEGCARTEQQQREDQQRKQAAAPAITPVVGLILHQMLYIPLICGLEGGAASRAQQRQARTPQHRHNHSDG
jgi:hypothetical protein